MTIFVKQMDNIKITTSVDITATIAFTEGQLKALDAMAGYGIEPFLKVFYEKLGKCYMQPYENDLRDLFIQIKSTVPTAMKAVKEARQHLRIV